MTKNLLFLLFAIFILSGCRTDITDTLIESSNIGQEKKYFIKKNELSNQLVIEKLSSIQSNSINNKNEDNVLEGRIILDNRILVVEDENHNKSYTFPVRNIKDTTSALENLVVIPDKDSYRAFILRYNVNKKEREKIVKGEMVEGILAKTELIDVDNNKITLPTNPQNKGGEYNSDTYNYGCVKLIVTTYEAYTCEYCESWTTWEIDISGCSHGGNGGGGGGSGGDGGGGESGGGPGGGGSTGGGTTPIEEESPDSEAEYQNRVTNFRNQLNGSQYDWFTHPENKFIGLDLADIYNQYPTSQSFNFLTSLIDNVNSNSSNIIFLYQAKNYLMINGLDTNTMEVINNLKNSINNNSINYSFSEWAFNFLNQNLSTTWTEFQNWFMGNGEGNDGGDIFDINDYTNVNVQTYTTLPSRNNFYSAFPKNGTEGMVNTAVYQLVGGSLYNLHLTYPSTYWNACAIRVSRALNYAGQPVPVFKNDNGKQRTEKGADNKNYILDAASMLAYMLKAYPNNPPLHLENKSPEEYLNALKGKWGIYIMLPKPNSNFGATGHADFFSYSGCLSGCYFTSAKEIYFWELN